MIPIPLPYKLAGAAVALIAAGAWGFSLGLAWNADDLAECESTIETIKGVQYELEQKAEHQRLVSERITQDVSKRWADALRIAESNPRIVRVRQDCGGTGGMPSVSIPATGLSTGTSIEGLNTVLDAAACEKRLNDGIVDAAQLAHLIYWVKQQSKYHEPTSEK